MDFEKTPIDKKFFAGFDKQSLKMIAALAAIDAELGLPEDGCNSTARTLAALRLLKARATPINLKVEKDTIRYRWLRAQDWNTSRLAVVANPKVAIGLGHDSPARARLDDAIDMAMAAERASGAPYVANNRTP